MTPLRRRMPEDMQLRSLSANAQKSYVHHVSLFARHFRRSPERLGPRDIRIYQVHLTNEKQLAPATAAVATAAVCYAAALRDPSSTVSWRHPRLVCHATWWRPLNSWNEIHGCMDRLRTELGPAGHTIRLLGEVSSPALAYRLRNR